MPVEALEAWNLYLLLQDQQRIGMDVIGLDYTVLPVVFDVYEVPRWRRRVLFEQLVTLNHAFTGHRARQREREAEEQRAKRALR